VTRHSDDAANLVREAENEVTDRRQAGGYPSDLLERMDAELAPDGGDYATAPEALAYLPSARPIIPRRRWDVVLSPAKRVIRRLLSWYIHPITVDQSRFNAAITRELRALERRIRAMETDSRSGTDDGSTAP